jgi:hypothetical protein
VSQAVKHFSLHRIDGTELQVIADVESGVLSVINGEEEVIRRYIEEGIWPHERVMLFILQDLRPLVRQLQSMAQTPPGGEQVLQHRPIVNLYDLADRAGCQIFVNCEAMAREGYWQDATMTRALLAHEHAHPLAECDTTAASRGLHVELVPAESLRDVLGAESRWVEVCRVLDSLARKLCLDAPREVLTNDLTIRGGFGDALLTLDRHNVDNAKSSLVGRKQVSDEIERAVGAGELTREAADLLLLVGDMQGYLDMAIETAPFYRTGRESQAQELEKTLEDDVFGHLHPSAGAAYLALRDRYIALRTDLSPAALVRWCEDVLGILTGSFAGAGVNVEYRVREV